MFLQFYMNISIQEVLIQGMVEVQDASTIYTGEKYGIALI